MDIHSADFVVSNAVLEKCPTTLLPEYAFIGRSNVGKSSLINMLTHRKKLAKTSGTPGKTQLINHFLINKAWHLVDLPGYGYAQTSKKNKRAFQQLISSYFQKRKQLVSAFVLIDSRHQPQKIDLDFLIWLGQKGIPFNIIFTKSDKLKPAALQKNLTHYHKELEKSWSPLPNTFVSSSIKRTGREEILNYIEQLNNAL